MQDKMDDAMQFKGLTELGIKKAIWYITSYVLPVVIQNGDQYNL